MRPTCEGCNKPVKCKPSVVPNGGLSLMRKCGLVSRHNGQSLLLVTGGSDMNIDYLRHGALGAGTFVKEFNWQACEKKRSSCQDLCWHGIAARPRRWS